MIKLLFGRLLPAGAAAVILTSALSPLRPALDAFGAAAIALTGQEPAPVEGGADFGNDLIPQRPSRSKPREQKKKLQELASRLRDPNAPQLKEFQAPANARSEPRFRPLERVAGTPPRAPFKLQTVGVSLALRNFRFPPDAGEYRAVNFVTTDREGTHEVPRTGRVSEPFQPLAHGDAEGATR